MPILTDIIMMVRHPEWLNDQEMSPAQEAILRAIYGLPMTAEMLALFLTLTEGRQPRVGGYTEVTMICGVRSGKTDKIVANCALWEALTFDPKLLAPGEKAYIPIIAQNIEGAQQAWGYVEGKARLLEEKGRRNPRTGGPILDPGMGQMKSVTGKEIRFSNRVIVRTFPCNKSGVRGKTCIIAIGDEFAFWDTSETAFDSDMEIFRSLRTRMATMKGKGKLLKITSPYGEAGTAFEDFEERKTAKRLFVQVPSWILNPKLLEGPFLQEQQELDPEGYNREYGAQFGKKGGTYLVPHRVDEAMADPRPQVIQPQSNTRYAGWIDVAFKHDLYAFAIAHQDEARGVIFDLVAYWKGSKKYPLDSKAIAKEISGYLANYGLDVVRGDQYASVPVSGDFKECKVHFIECPDNANNSWAMFQGLKASFRHGRIHLPKDPMIRRDLLSLVLVKAGPNQIPRVSAPERSGLHDDISKVVASLVQYFEPIRLTTVDIEKWNAEGFQGKQDLTTITGRRMAVENARHEEDDFDEFSTVDDILNFEF